MDLCRPVHVKTLLDDITFFRVYCQICCYEFTITKNGTNTKYFIILAEKTDTIPITRSMIKAVAMEEPNKNEPDLTSFSFPKWLLDIGPNTYAHWDAQWTRTHLQI